MPSSLQPSDRPTSMLPPYTPPVQPGERPPPYHDFGQPSSLGSHRPLSPAEEDLRDPPRYQPWKPPRGLPNWPATKAIKERRADKLRAEQKRAGRNLTKEELLALTAHQPPRARPTKASKVGQADKLRDRPARAERNLTRGELAALMTHRPL